MKKLIYIFLITTSLLTAFSCSKWLDVKPKAEIKSDVMFETEQGFKDAIIGCYIMMSDPSLYGGELTCTFMDVLAQQYEFLGTTSSTYYNAAQYQYTSYQSKITAFWSKSYNVIANLNNIIDNIDVKKNVLHPTNYAIIKAEAYGLRAYIYFDLIRMFSYGNLKERKDVLSNLSIPYAKKYDKVMTKQHTLKEVLEFLHSDIDTALDLFMTYDPWSPMAKPDGYEIPNDDLFYDKAKRPYRFNIKAAFATRMRINMWEGNYEDALDDANELILATGDWGTNWVSESDINNPDQKLRDLVFSKEQLFGLETFKRFDDLIKNYFKPTASDDLNMNYQCLYLTKSKVESIYEIANSVGSSDYRYTRWFDKTTNNYTIIKFWEYERMLYTNNIPLIRKSEIYYTAAECLLNTGDNDNKRKAIGYINQVRNARGIPVNINLSLELSVEDANKELYKEWKKDFLGEGQLFYYYKRLGYSTITGSNTPGNDKLYIFPLPETEIDLGSRFDPNIDPNKKL